MVDEEAWEEACEESGGEPSGTYCYLETESSAGHGLITKVTPSEISSRRAKDLKAEDIVRVGEVGEAERELARKLGRKPVMEIRKGKRGYSVDFEAGLKRGWFPDQSREAVCDALPDGLNRISSNRPWIEWVGLSCDMPIVKKFLGE